MIIGDGERAEFEQQQEEGWVRNTSHAAGECSSSPESDRNKQKCVRLHPATTAGGFAPSLQFGWSPAPPAFAAALTPGDGWTDDAWVHAFYGWTPRFLFLEPRALMGTQRNFHGNPEGFPSSAPTPRVHPHPSRYFSTFTVWATFVMIPPPLLLPPVYLSRELTLPYLRMNVMDESSVLDDEVHSVKGANLRHRV